MERCAETGDHEHPKGDANLNGHNKWIGLLRCRPQVFFTYGPGEDWNIFEVDYGNKGQVTFKEGPRDLLRPPAV